MNTVLIALISAVAAVVVYAVVTNLVAKTSIRKRREAALKEAEAEDVETVADEDDADADSDADPDGGDKNFLDCLNPGSLEVLQGAKLEASLADAQPADRFQFLRMGYFCKDKDSTAELPVYNRTVGLKDSWAKVAK